MYRQAMMYVELFANSEGVTVKNLLGKSRKMNLVKIRRDCIRKIREYAHLSLSEIGALFGGRDHTTILHYLNQEGWR